MGLVRAAAAAALLLPLLSCTASPADPSDARRGTERACVERLVAGERSPGCRGVRVRPPVPGFVPQGLALAGDRTAYLSGYDGHAPVGSKVCLVSRVDLRSGRPLRTVERFDGAVVPGGEVLPCRHGGGIALTRHGLWVAATGRLWLLDPALPADPVRRIWWVDLRSKASTLAASRGSLLVGKFRSDGPSRLHRYRIADLLAPGTTRLSPDPAPGTHAAVDSRRVPSRLQGVAAGPGGTWLVRSTTFCGELVAPGGRRFPFVPGGEGLAFEGGDGDDAAVWVASESGSRPYQRLGGRPDVPTLVRVDLDRLDRTTPADCWVR
jgi:hypothetical protein